MSALHLCVIAPYLQGGYMGEIINHIRRTCATREYRFTLIRTNSLGEFSLNLGASEFDGVITIRNAASPKMVEYLQNRAIPVVAIAHDYFPLDVPIITSNNAKGMDLAFNYLVERGHKKITFIGDLSQYDLRKRFERFCELLDEHIFQLTDKSLICVDDTLFTGGREAAARFVKHVDQVDAVICGAGNTGMGFVKQLKAQGINLPEKLEVISFDDVAFMELITPGMPRIDQNLDQVAAHALEALEALITQTPLTTHTLHVDPTLIVGKPATAERNWQMRVHELDGLNNLNYVDSLVNNSFELTHKILNSNLDKLMSLAPLFQQHMHLACLAELKKDKFNRTRLKIKKIFESASAEVLLLDDEENLVPIESYPGKAFKEKYGNNHPTLVHFPIFVDDELWGFISVFGDPQRASYPTSFTGFTGYMDTIAHSYSLLLSKQQHEIESETTEPLISETPDVLTPYLKWDLETGGVVWNEKALEKLGFTTDLEKSIYRNMEVFDRVHPEDEHNLRKEITLSLSHLDRMNTLVRLKLAQGGYAQFRIEGEVVQKKNDRAVIYRCVISQIN